MNTLKDELKQLTKGSLFNYNEILEILNLVDPEIIENVMRARAKKGESNIIVCVTPQYCGTAYLEDDDNFNITYPNDAKDPIIYDKIMQIVVDWFNSRYLDAHEMAISSVKESNKIILTISWM